MIASLFRTAVITSGILYLCATPAQAVEINTLLDLKSACISATMVNQTSCSSYIDGVIGAYWASVALLKEHNLHMEFFCTTKSEEHDMKSDRVYVRKYIMSRPDEDTRHAGRVIFEALHEAYGCKA
ncbi:MAG: Rap1a/Tai family immunity protein [Candidatus Nitrotoga sp.]|nr:Rap1a/Tai family immunity protein [Candidatus Nitrotoga sp.]